MPAVKSCTIEASIIEVLLFLMRKQLLQKEA